MNLKRNISIIAFLMGLTLTVAAQGAKGGSNYDKRVAEFAKRHDIDTQTVVMYGNSLTEKAGDWEERIFGSDPKERHPRVVNYGISGDHLAGMQKRLRQVTRHHPKVIFFMGGINDVCKSVTAAQVFERQKKLIETIRRQSPGTKLYVQSLLPFTQSVRTWKPLIGQERKVQAVNTRLKEYCRKHRLTFINLYPLFTAADGKTLRRDLTTDGLHLNDAGYAVWIKELRKYL